MKTDSIAGDTLRNQVLDVFLAHLGEYVSSAEICQQTNVSRTAIWKHVKALEDLGFCFESSPRKGHKLVSSPDILLPSLLKRKLAQRHVSIGHHVLWYPEVDSTNRVALLAAQEGALHGTVVSAAQQTGGKGRRGRVWFSPSTGLWNSIIFRRHIPVRRAADLTLLTCIAVRRVLTQHTGMPIQIKWPNDLLLHGRKICGILAEIRADGENLHYAVVGIGMNTNIPAEDFPEELKQYATSLMAESGQSVNHLAVATDLFEELDHLFTGLQEGHGFERVVEEWREYSATLGRNVTILTPQGTVTGFAEDIDATGILYVRKEDGTTQAIHSGDVLF